MSVLTPVCVCVCERACVCLCLCACVLKQVIESIDFSASVFMLARGVLSAEVNKRSVQRWKYSRAEPRMRPADYGLMQRLSQLDCRRCRPW